MGMFFSSMMLTSSHCKWKNKTCVKTFKYLLWNFQMTRRPNMEYAIIIRGNIDLSAWKPLQFMSMWHISINIFFSNSLTVTNSKMHFSPTNHSWIWNVGSVGFFQSRKPFHRFTDEKKRICPVGAYSSHGLLSEEQQKNNTTLQVWCHWKSCRSPISHVLTRISMSTFKPGRCLCECV